MINIKNVSLDFGTQTIFNDISATIQPNERIGLVGSNGTGKTTLLEAIVKKQQIDDGQIFVSPSLSIGYMPQELVLKSDLPILEHAIKSCELLDDTEIEQKKTKAKIILNGLGFSLDQMNQPVDTLSTGWKMRLLLGELLLKESNFYLFDEPTNHLDIVSKQWLLDFIEKSTFGYILISHDRYFLNHLCKKIFELEQGNLFVYNGNYDKYKLQKEQRIEKLIKEYELQQKDISKKKRTIERFRASATKAKMAKSMERSLEKMELIQLPQTQSVVNFSFASSSKSNRIVLKVENLSHTFESKKIFQNISFEVERGEKIAIVAANGVGKTTLLKLITGSLEKQNGKIENGDRVKLGIFEQDQEIVLDHEKTIIQTVEDGNQHITSKEIRSLLGCFLFSGDSIEKKIEVLSGGEKNRVSMAKILSQNTNFLLLDEPTNHLDIQSKEILLQALKKYAGTILFVSHDQDFINNLATKVFELTPNGIYLYHGNYDEYLYQKSQIKNETNKTQLKKEPCSKKSNQKKQYLQRKESKKLEQKIDKTEKEISTLSEKIGTLSYGTKEFEKIHHELLELEKNLKRLFSEWEELQKKIN